MCPPPSCVLTKMNASICHRFGLVYVVEMMARSGNNDEILTRPISLWATCFSQPVSFYPGVQEDGSWGVYSLEFRCNLFRPKKQTKKMIFTRFFIQILFFAGINPLCKVRS